MEIGIVGTGSVGRALATGLTAAGHDVVVGSRTPETKELTDAPVVSHREAVARDDCVILAVPAAAAPTVAAEFRAELADTPVVDAANEYPTASSESSLAARVASAAPDARVVKAFNTIGANLMTDPAVAGERATMFLAGDDADAVERVASLALDLGFAPLVAGGLDAATHLENLARFWIHLSGEYGRDVAFRFLRNGARDG